MSAGVVGMISGESIEAGSRALEAEYKRGFDAGVEYQKKALPPPKAHELKQKLEQLGREHRAACDAWSAKETKYQADFGTLRAATHLVIDALELALKELEENGLNHDTVQHAAIIHRWNVEQAGESAIAAARASMNERPKVVGP